MSSRLRIAIALHLALVAAGCGGAGAAASPGGSSSSPSGSGPAASANGSAPSRAQQQLAIAALGPSYTPQPIAFDAAALAAWNELVARSWPAYRKLVDPRIASGIQALAGRGGQVSIQGIRNVAVDTQAPPAFEASGAAPLQSLIVRLPAAPGAWTIAFTADVGATVPVFGVAVPVSVAIDVEASAIRVDAPAAFDLSNPARPALVGTGAPQIAMQLRLHSSDPVVSQIAGALTQLLDPIVRAALVAGSLVAEQQIGAAVTQLPQTPWGLGAPPASAVPGAAPLAPLADRIADDIARDHLPFDTLLPAVFSQPGYGNGAVADYADFGDSAIWTGHYLMAEAMRWDLTGDPRALDGARRAVRGLGACLDVAIPGDGLLSRCAVPLSSPVVADIQGAQDYFVGTANGQSCGALESISRDQYIGALLGLTQAYLRVPALRADSAALISRMVAYLEAHDWIAYRIDGVTPSAPFGQSPGVFWAFLKSANLVDPARWGPLHDHYKPVTSLLWLFDYTGSVEVHDEYFKFNLGHGCLADMVATETDPAAYRDYAKCFEVLRGAIGHHDNAWFDTVYAIAIPASAPAIGPRIEAELERWALRDRRGFAAANSQDPSIAKAVYSSRTSASLPKTLAVYPVPIEKRPPTDFLWQRDPFELDGSDPPTVQYPGVDLLLPYWAARSFGLIP